MLTNAVFISSKPIINILPKMLIAIAECMSADEEYVTFCIQEPYNGKDFDKVLKGICKGLEKQGYETETYYIVDDMRDEPLVEEDWAKMYYIRVKWSINMSSFVQKVGKEASKYVN